MHKAVFMERIKLHNMHKSSIMGKCEYLVSFYTGFVLKEKEYERIDVGQ